jgi:hypothetical protein
MLMLAAWCRRSNIPCDVYGFSDGIGHKWQGCVNGQVSSPWVHRDSETNRATLDEGMRLVHLISTKGLSDRDWRTTAGGLLAVWGARHDYTAMSNSNGQWGSDEQYRQTQRLFALNSTPTTAATAAALDLVEQFKRQNGLQIVHFVTLTDGEASDYVHASGRPTGQKTSWGGDHYVARSCDGCYRSLSESQPEQRSEGSAQSSEQACDGSAFGGYLHHAEARFQVAAALLGSEGGTAG